MIWEYAAAECLGVLVRFGSVKLTWYIPNFCVYPLPHSKLSIRDHAIYPLRLTPSFLYAVKITNVIIIEILRVKIIYLHLFSYMVIQHYFHIRRCSGRLTVTNLYDSRRQYLPSRSTWVHNRFLVSLRHSRSFVFCVVLWRPLSFYSLSFWHGIVCPSSKYGFWLHLWYFHTWLLVLLLFIHTGSYFIEKVGK